MQLISLVLLSHKDITCITTDLEAWQDDTLIQSHDGSVNSSQTSLQSVFAPQSIKSSASTRPKSAPHLLERKNRVAPALEKENSPPTYSNTNRLNSPGTTDIQSIIIKHVYIHNIK